MDLSVTAVTLRRTANNLVETNQITRNLTSRFLNPNKAGLFKVVFGEAQFDKIEGKRKNSFKNWFLLLGKLKFSFKLIVIEPTANGGRNDSMQFFRNKTQLVCFPVNFSNH